MFLTLFRQYKEAHRLAWLFFLGALPLFLLPVVFEGLQHIAEWHLGMFSGETIEGRAHNIRIAFGALKVLSLFFVSVLLPRYFLKNRDLKAAVSFEPKARRMIWIVVIFLTAYVGFVFLIMPQIIKTFMPDATTQQEMLAAVASLLLFILPIQNKMNGVLAQLWGQSPLSRAENKAIYRAMTLNFPVLIAALAPAMWLHSYLNGLAIKIGATGGQDIRLFALLAIDNVVVGVLGALMAASLFIAFRDGRNSMK